MMGNNGRIQALKPSPDARKVSTVRLTKGASWSRNKRTILTCVRQLAPFASRGSALPGQRRSVSLRFRVAMLLKTQFACHRIRGKRTTKEERIHSFYYLNTLFRLSYAGFLPLPLVGYGVSLYFSVATLLKIQFACHRF